MRIKYIALLCTFIHAAVGDYECLCNYSVQQAVYAGATTNAASIGDLYEFDCKPTVHGSEVAGFKTIQFEQQVGYVEMNDDIQIQICAGQVSPLDAVSTTTAPIIANTTLAPTSPTTIRSTSILTSAPTTIMTTKLTTITTSTRATTTTPTLATTTSTRATSPTPTSATTTSTTTTPTTATTIMPTSKKIPTTAIKTTTPKILQGHLEVCQAYLKTDISQYHGFLGQYGSFCYELVDWTRAFKSAESHCVSLSGTLAAITNQGEQDYIMHFLSAHGYTKQAWIGLNDMKSEGTLTWTSGAPVSYTNFQNAYNQHSTNTHKTNDCFVINQSGEWIDQPCGVAISIINFGEQHPFICQYNVSAKLHSLFDVFPGVVAVG